MIKNLRKAIASLLTVIMCMGTVSVTSFAEEEFYPGVEDGKEIYVVDEQLVGKQEQDLSEEEQITEDNEAEELSNIVINAQDVLIDNSDSKHFDDLSGGEIVNGGFGGDFVKTTKAKFVSDVTENGVYRVYIYNPKSDFKADGVIVVVKEAVKKTIHTVDFDDERAGQWLQLGTFQFSDKQDVEILIKSADGERIKADAVKIEFISGDYTFDPEEIGGKDYLKTSEEYGNIYNQIARDKAYYVPADKAGMVVTRADASMAIANMMSLENTMQTSVYFKDVPTDHPYCGVINALAGQGVVLGNGEGIFRPDDDITVQEFMLMMLRAIGYDYDGRVLDFEDHWFTISDDIGLLDGVSFNAAELLTAEDMTEIIYNALDIRIMHMTINGDTFGYFEDDETVSERYLGVKRYEGIITDNGYTALSGKTAMGKGYAEINETRYKAEYSQVGELLGRKAEYYATEDDEIVYLFETSENSIIRVSAPDLMKEDSSYTKANVVYSNDNGKNKNIKIPKDAYVIYNGEALLSYDTADFKITEGDITFIDNNRDNTVDVVIIRNVTYYAVERTYPATGKLSAYNADTAITFEESDKYKAVLVNPDGKEIGVGDIKSGDVIAYMQSKGADDYVKTAYLLDVAPVSGEISRIGDDVLEIGAAEYEYAESYPQTNISLGSTVVAYLTWDNMIFHVINEGATGEEYGYLMKVRYSEDEEVAAVKLFNKNGSFSELNMADKVSYNGKKKTQDEIWELLKGKPQLVKYSTNRNGELSKIKTAEDMTGVKNYLGYDMTKFTLDYTSKDAIYIKTYSSFDGIHSLHTQSLIMQVPYPNGEYVEDEDFYGIVSYDKLKHCSDVPYVIKQYDFDDEYIVNAMVIYSDKTAASMELDISTSPIFVTGIHESIDSNDELTYVISGIGAGGEATYMYSPEKDIRSTNVEWGNMNVIPSESGEKMTYAGISIKDLKFGDIVQFGVGPKGLVSDMRIIHRVSYHTPEMGGENVFESGYNYHKLNEDNCYSAIYAGYGKVVEIKGNWIYYETDAADGSGTWLRKCSTSGKYFFLDVKKERIEETAWSSLCVGDTILMRGYYGEPQEVFIIEN